jgi:hypothetical protein
MPLLEYEEKPLTLLFLGCEERKDNKVDKWKCLERDTGERKEGDKD